jgi:hypothetical protein
MNKTQFTAGWMCFWADTNPETRGNGNADFMKGYDAAWMRCVMHGYGWPRREDALKAAEAYLAEEEAHAASVARIDARMAEGLCCVSYDGRQFTCNNRVSAENLDHGCAVCDACAQKDLEREGYYDGEAQRRMEGRGE